MIPEEHIGVLALTNSTPVGLPESICLTFLDYVHYGKQQREYLPLIGPMMQHMMAEAESSSPNYATLPPSKDPATAKPLNTYVGTYSNEYFGRLEVSIEDNRLILRLPPRGAYYELTHWDGDTFTYHSANETSALGRRGVKFSPDKHQVLIEDLALEHNSVFTRIE